MEKESFILFPKWSVTLKPIMKVTKVLFSGLGAICRFAGPFLCILLCSMPAVTSVPLWYILVAWEASPPTSRPQTGNVRHWIHTRSLGNVPSAREADRWHWALGHSHSAVWQPPSIDFLTLPAAAGTCLHTRDLWGLSHRGVGQWARRGDGPGSDGRCPWLVPSVRTATAATPSPLGPGRLPHLQAHEGGRPLLCTSSHFSDWEA